jgi:hypothetical protein
MIIDIDDKFRIRGTRHCWQLEQFYKNKTGDYWQAFKYFPTLPLAVHSAVQHELRLDPAHELSEILSAVDRLTKKCDRIFDGIGKPA